MAGQFPNLSFIATARQMETEGVEGGRRSNQITIEPVPLSVEGDEGEASEDSARTALIPAEDMQETQERLTALERYLPYAALAYGERQLVYPFAKSIHGDCLSVSAGQADFAKKCAELSGLCSKGGQSAKVFERRAASALHRLIGGWCVCVGAPRLEVGLGPEKAVQKFRAMHVSEIGPDDPHEEHPKNGDYGADALWILGRAWGGPLVYLQVKNSDYSLRNAPEEFLRVSEVIRSWFGRRIDQRRIVIPVLAVNTVLTRELKEDAFECCGAGRGYHILDAVDILHAEALPKDFLATRDVLTEL